MEARREKEADEMGGGEQRKRERERIKLHGHTYMDNLTCILLIQLWRRMKELVPGQQAS